MGSRLHVSKNKSGGEHVQEQTPKKEKKPGTMLSLGRGPTTGVGKRLYRCIPFCAVRGFSTANR